MAVIYGVPSGPRIIDVYIGALSGGRGKLWTSSFLNYLEAQNLGSSILGYRIPVGVTVTTDAYATTKGQLNPLAWANLNCFSLSFNTDVNVNINSLTINGILNTYTINSFDYRVVNGKYTASWFFSQSSTPPESDLIVRDKIRIILSSSSVSYKNRNIPLAGGIVNATWTSSGDASTSAGSSLPSTGANNSDFSLRLNLLPGHARSITTLVGIFDILFLNQHNNTNVDGIPNSNGRVYNPFMDITGDGNIFSSNDDESLDDRRYASLYLNSSLPTGTI